MPTHHQFEVDRSDFRATRVTETPTRPLEVGEIRLSVERFALTSNNISYVVAGDMLDYWGFFPSETNWGCVPAMGLGSVVESAHAEIEVGGRYFGFYPMANEVVIAAAPRNDGFRDVGVHRSNHAPTYTDFREVSHDPMFDASLADHFLLLRGVFMTSFLIDDSLVDNDFHGAQQTVITSASSKTSICLAHCLAQRNDHHCIGVTSARNRSFVDGLGLYDEVLIYDEVEQLDSDTPSTLVDMAGNSTVRAAVHARLADQLKASLTVGSTHWEQSSGLEVEGELVGPQPEFFFAPGQAAKRASEWGPAELAARIALSFRGLLGGADNWLSVAHRTGPDGVADAYRQVLEGEATPDSGYVVSMNEHPLT